MVPVSGSYSSVFSLSNAIPIGSCRNEERRDGIKQLPIFGFQFPTLLQNFFACSRYSWW
jgi:hypothetical protein